MLTTTRGIVLHQTKYSETSLIVKAYTEHFGQQSYLVKGVRKARAQTKQNLFSPLSLVEVVVHKKETANLHIAKEISCHTHLIAINTDIRKTTLAIFINELIYKTIQNEMHDPQLFRFLWNSVLELELEQTQVADFHLHFMVQLANELGFMPQQNFSEQNRIFNLQEGLFCHATPDHPYYLSPQLSDLFAQILDTKSNHPQNFHYQSRQQLLEALLVYFKLHLPLMGEMKSHKVLAELLKN